MAAGHEPGAHRKQWLPANRNRFADILREELDGAVGTDAESMTEKKHDTVFWTQRREEIEAAAKSAGRP